MAIWPAVVRTVDIVEGACGTVLNCAVIYQLWHRKESTKLLTFRICITVISLQGLFTAMFDAALCNTVHLIHVDAFLIIQYGSISLISESIGNFLVTFSLFPPFCMLHLIPGACLLHYLTLCRPRQSKSLRLLLAYGPCVAMLLWSTPYFLSIHGADRFTALVREVHHAAPTDRFVTMGMALMPTVEHPKAMINFALECVIPSYTISYGIFALTALKCRSHLSSINIKFSEKTLAMHRRFLIMLALENLLPLVVLAIPIGIFCIALIGGLNVGLITLIVSFSCWTLPIVQGSVSLMFALRLNKTSSTESGKSSSQPPKISITKAKK